MTEVSQPIRRTTRLAGLTAAATLAAKVNPRSPENVALLEAIQLSLVSEYSKPKETTPEAKPVVKQRKRSKSNGMSSPDDSAKLRTSSEMITPQQSHKAAPLSRKRPRPTDSCGSTHRRRPRLDTTDITHTPSFLQSETSSFPPSNPNIACNIPDSLGIEDFTPDIVDAAASSAVDTSHVNEKSAQTIHDNVACSGSPASSINPTTPVAIVTPALDKVRKACEDDVGLSIESRSWESPLSPIQNSNEVQHYTTLDSIDTFKASATPAQVSAVSKAAPERGISIADLRPDTFRVFVSQKQANAVAIEDRYFCMVDLGASLGGSIEAAENVEISDGVEALVVGVADGHGGDDVAKHVSTYLPRAMLRETRTCEDVVAVQTGINRAFKLCDEAWLKNVPKAGAPGTRMDQTFLQKCRVGACVVAILIKKLSGNWVMFTANCGDSRAVLARFPPTSSTGVTTAYTRSPATTPHIKAKAKHAVDTMELTKEAAACIPDAYNTTLSAVLSSSTAETAARVAHKLSQQVTVSPYADHNSVLDHIRQRFESLLTRSLHVIPLSTDMKSCSLSEIRDILVRSNGHSKDPCPIRFFTRLPMPSLEDKESSDKRAWETALQDALRKLVVQPTSFRNATAAATTTSNSLASNTLASSALFGGLSHPERSRSPVRDPLIASRTEAIVQGLTAQDPCRSLFGGVYQPRVAGSLAVTGAMGDAYLKMGDRSLPPFSAGCPYITCEPKIVTHHLKPSDKFVVIGSDGLWDFSDNRNLLAVAAMAIEDEMRLHADCDARTASNAIGTDVRSFVKATAVATATTSSAGAAEMRPGAGLSRSYSSSFVRPEGVAIADNVTTLVDCVAGDPSQRLIGYSLCELIEEARKQEKKCPELQSLSAMLRAPLKLRRQLHDDVTAFVLLLPSALFEARAPRTIPRESSVSSSLATPATVGRTSFLTRQISLNNLASPRLPSNSALQKDVAPRNGNHAPSEVMSLEMATKSSPKPPAALITRYFDPVKR